VSHRPPPAARDAGMTMVEVLVATGLFVVLSGMLATVSILGLRSSDGIGVRLDNTNQTQLGMAAVTRVLRTAVLPEQLDDQTCSDCADTAIIQASATRVTFYANLDNVGQGPSLVTLQVVQDTRHAATGMLQQVSQPPIALADGRYTFCTAGASGCTVQTRVLSRGLAWPASPVFGYYDFDGALITGSPLAAADLPRVSSVDVAITSQTRPSQSAYPAATAVQRVRLPNADINVLVQPS
jgi:hypothetical protein